MTSPECDAKNSGFSGTLYPCVPGHEIVGHVSAVGSEADHPNVRFHFTPTGASWLNMIEAWFGILTRKSVRRGSFPSVRSLVQHIGTASTWDGPPHVAYDFDPDFRA